MFCKDLYKKIVKDFLFNICRTFKMRVSYIAPGVSQFDDVFKANNLEGLLKGGGLGDIKTINPNNCHIRGGSLFGILENVFKRTLPFVTNFVLPEAGNFARNLISDMGNVPLKKS